MIGELRLPSLFWEIRLKLIALKPLLYAGKSLLADDAFEASDRDARLLKAIGKAADAPDKAEDGSIGKPRSRRAKTGV